jgi:hypothetical protein
MTLCKSCLQLLRSSFLLRKPAQSTSSPGEVISTRLCMEGRYLGPYSHDLQRHIKGMPSSLLHIPAMVRGIVGVEFDN